MDTHVFFEEALTASSTKVTVMGSGETNVTLNAHISNTQQKDNSYSLTIDQAALDAYNKANGTNYIALPETHYTLPDNITIKAGAYNADPISIHIKAFSEEMNASGESYALPVRLVAKQGSIDVMPVTGSLVILANSIMEFSAPQFVGSTELVAKKFSRSAIPPIVTVQYSAHPVATVRACYYVSKTRKAIIMTTRLTHWFRFRLTKPI